MKIFRGRSSQATLRNQTSNPALLPWYADHPTDVGIRQESYFLKVVLPFVERTYPARTERDGRLLLGGLWNDRPCSEGVILKPRCSWVR